MWNEIAGNPLFDLLLLILVLRLIYPQLFRRTIRAQGSSELHQSVEREERSSKKKSSANQAGEYIDFEEIHHR